MKRGSKMVFSAGDEVERIEQRRWWSILRSFLDRIGWETGKCGEEMSNIQYLLPARWALLDGDETTWNGE